MSETKNDAPTPLPENQVSDLAKIIEESKQTIAETEQVAPKKRGRPKKSVSEASTLPASKDVSSNGAQVQDASLLPILRHAVALPFTISAERTGCEKLRLEKDETEELAKQADVCLQTYLPNLSAKGSVLAVTLFSFAAVSVAKVMVYQEWKKEQEAKIQKESEVEKIHVEAPIAQPKDFSALGFN